MTYTRILSSLILGVFEVLVSFLSNVHCSQRTCYILPHMFARKNVEGVVRRTIHRVNFSVATCESGKKAFAANGISISGCVSLLALLSQWRF